LPRSPYRIPGERAAYPAPKRPPLSRQTILASVLLASVLVTSPATVALYLTSRGGIAFVLLAAVQLATTVLACVNAIAHVWRGTARAGEKAASGCLGCLTSILVLGGAFVAWFLDALKGVDFSGGAWGRPLRLRGRILHPRLRAGSDWTRGARPDARGLDAPTRAALEALWLHDAQKEHASVPAFSRISWQLAAIGAPAELVERAHRAALDEIDHARRCFALAAGYGGRSHGVEAMPDLLVGGLETIGDPLARIATESLSDGCMLEDYNADVAAACEATCTEPAVKDVLARIALEERSHADFSWDLLQWLVARGDERVARAVERAASELEAMKRPTAVSSANATLVARADVERMRAHGRIPDTEWAALWAERLMETKRRVSVLLAPVRSVTGKAPRRARASAPTRIARGARACAPTNE